MAINIKLNSGRIISADNFNGSYFCTSENLSPDDFAHGELAHVEISGEIIRTDENNNKSTQLFSEIMQNAKLASLINNENGSEFALYTLPPTLAKIEKFNADLQYLAIMNGIDLDI